MSADAQGNDLSKVNVPLTGFAAVQLEGKAAFVAAEAGGKPELQLPENYVKVGLFTEDGGPASSSEAGDAIVFFQDGYQIGGSDELTVEIKLAEMNDTVRQLIRGKKADVNGMIVVDSSTPNTTFPLFVATQFKNGMQLRRNGLARISKVETDQEKRGEVNANKVTFTWLYNDEIKGKYREWLVDPTASQRLAK
ncbi:hypothetical protein [Arcanobacterium canis]